MTEPQLSALQRAWLREIGIDARMLQHLAPPAVEAAPVIAAHADGAGASAPARSDTTGASGMAHGDTAHASRMARADRADASNAARSDTAGASGMTRVDAGTSASSRRGTGPAQVLADVLRSVPAVSRLVSHSPAEVEALQNAALAVTDTPHTLASLQAAAEQCTACGLNEMRSRVVFGEGASAAPQWMFIGEAPGEYDDSVGKPFQGRPGELLQAMLASLGCTDTSTLYFANVVKCRPLGNRSPEPAEVAACMAFLRAQIRLLQPRYLVALGRVAAGAILGNDEDLDTLRGRAHTYRDGELSIPVVVTHHPAVLLLHGRLKAEAWQDLNLLRSLPL